MHNNYPPPHVQDINQRRSSINLVLNPHAPNRASQVALPSLGSLDLLTITYRDLGEPLPSATRRPNNVSAGFSQEYRNRNELGDLGYMADNSTQLSPPWSSPCWCQGRQECRQHGSPGGYRRSSSVSSSLHMSSRSASPTLPAHSNIPYSLEQVHFIQYYREDKHFQWQAIVHPFMTQFPKVAFPLPQHQSNSAKRNKGALECRYYRAQLFPKIDDGGNIVFDQNGEVEMVNIKLRERNNHQHKDVLHDYFTLVTRCPQKVIEYSWTDEEDKVEAQKIINDRARRGIGRLPGDILRVRPTPESIQ
ncbi:hypothetical protein V495_03563 [Pseudogymnoascus sp. VKM F-4514 (FW-929)]|nr:hypothetical protein V495_03563 [Pseudogymnoascus sp. VKM F-4514 (FW-929)]KFY57867.1 hypothetical protein V497_05271 [Pseudogymnoascus sp. VKM F-4516 (FW-969)]